VRARAVMRLADIARPRTVEVVIGDHVVGAGFSSMVLADNVARLVNGAPLVMCQWCYAKPATHAGCGNVGGAFCGDCNVGGA